MTPPAPDVVPPSHEVCKQENVLAEMRAEQKAAAVDILEIKADLQEIKADQREIKECLVGGINHPNSISQRLTIVEREMEEVKKDATAWKSAFIYLSLAVAVWFLTSFLPEHLQHKRSDAVDPVRPSAGTSPSPTVLATTPRAPELSVPHVAEAP